MPELPEVETVLQGLLPVLEGKQVETADIRRDGLRWPFPPHLKKSLTGAYVTRLWRRSKYILADLQKNTPNASKESLLIHLGMSGRITVSGKMQGQFHHHHLPLQKHDHVVLYVKGGTRITFNDVRRFGVIDLLPTDNAYEHPLLAKLGPEPFGNDFNASYLAKRFAGKTSPIKTALLDQSIVAGLGNIYVCEILYRCRIHPETLAKDIPFPIIEDIIPVIKDVLHKAISAGGSSLRDHRQTDGNLGYFQHQFLVYGREGQICNGYGCTQKIIRIQQSGRSSFLCPNCQKGV